MSRVVGGSWGAPEAHQGGMYCFNFGALDGECLTDRHYICPPGNP